MLLRPLILLNGGVTPPPAKPPEGTEPPGEGLPPEPPADPQAPPPPAGPSKAELDAAEARAQAAEARLAEIEAAQKAAEEEEAKRQGEYQRLYEEAKAQLDEVTPKLAAHEQREQARIEALNTRNAERLAALPEGFGALIPEGLAPDKLSAQLDAVEKVANERPDRPAGGRQGGSKPPTPVPTTYPPEFVARMKRNGITDPKHPVFQRAWKSWGERNSRKAS